MPCNYYLCFRPGTQSKAPHARCRQYIFHTTADLMKWLKARRNSLEQVKIEVVYDGVTKYRIQSERRALCEYVPGWSPLP